MIAQSDVRVVRHALVDTLEALSPERLDAGRTLCDDWAPRDILAHLMGTAATMRFVRAPWRMHRINADSVAEGRTWSRAELFERGRAWADVPRGLDGMVARFLAGDVAMHHQDVVRGLGLDRQLTEIEENLLFWEGVVLTAEKAQPTLLRYRVEPTNGRGRALGRGRRVGGTAEELGLWLGGRRDIGVTFG